MQKLSSKEQNPMLTLELLVTLTMERPLNCSNNKNSRIRTGDVEVKSYDQIDSAPKKRKEELPSAPLTLSIKPRTVTMLTLTVPPR